MKYSDHFFITKNVIGALVIGALFVLIVTQLERWDNAHHPEHVTRIVKGEQYVSAK